MRCRSPLGWLVVVVVFVVTMFSNSAHAQDAVLVTVTNGTGSTAGRLEVTFSGAGGALSVDPFTVFATGCPLPAIGVVLDTVTIDWGIDCVVAGASVSFLATTPNGPLDVASGAWFSTGGVPLLGLLDTSGRAMYGTNGSELFTIDPSTAATTFIGAVGSFGIVADIDCAPDCVMYGGTGFGGGDLITIDQSSGAEAFIGNNGSPGENDSALEWVGSTLYGVISGSGVSPSTLVTIDPISGTATPIGLTGVGPIGGIAYNTLTGIMYGVEAGMTATGNLVRIDLTTGAATVIGPTGFAGVGALEFDAATGILYGGVGGVDPAGGDLVTIDLGTGAATSVGPTTYLTLSGITFCGGKVIVQRIGAGGIILPNGFLVVWRQRIRYQPIGLFYSPWFKPVGSCWTRWCCFVGQVCRRDINVYVYKTFFGRAFGLRRCIRVVRGQFAGVRGAGWGRQRRTIPPPPDEPVIPIIGPIPDPPPIPGLQIYGANDANGAIDRLSYTDDGGVSYRDGANAAQTFGAMLDAISPIVPGAGAPPPLNDSFQQQLQDMSAGWCAASQALQAFSNELQIVLNNEPDPWIVQVKNEIDIYAASMNDICVQMSTGNVLNPVPFFNASGANANLAALMAGVPLPGDATPDAGQRLGNASSHFDRCALGFQIAGDQVAQNMYDAINDTPERDTFFWHIIQHYPVELAMLAASLDRHVRLQVAVDGPVGWGFEAVEPIEVELVELQLVSLSPIPVTTIEMPVSHPGDLYIRRPDRLDGNTDADELFRVKVKFPTMLSRVVDVPPGDGLVLALPPMIPGDADGDNCITPNDLQIVIDNQGVGGEFAPVVPSADVNFDGIVDLQDQLVVQNNMGQCGQAIDDCDYNGVSDAIDIANGDLTDCNNNGIPDECEVASGIAADGNSNGVPDECDCPADITDSVGGPPDGTVNVFDLLELLANWGTNGTGANIAVPANNVVDVFDLLDLLAAWGDC